MLRAIIFDFNGILVDDEPIHLKMFQKVLSEEGVSLGEKDYYERYLGMDDRGCFKAALHDSGRELEESSLQEMIRRKAVYYREFIEKEMRVFAGVSRLIPLLSPRFALAIASGALRSEIELILASIDLRKHFQAIASAEDVKEGKPSPEIFLKALSLLNEARTGSPILPSECLVIEDSKEGILGASRAGIKCLAVANTYSAQELTQADAVVKSLKDVTIPFLEELLV
jgi:HAD superfamily hydrolase (TIGR01509 family)